MKPRATSTFLVASLLSALVWALSPVLSGHAEPWDADGSYYVSALALAGAVCGVLLPKPLWAHYIGAVLGQVAFELSFFNLGPLFPLGMLFLLGYSIVFVVAAAAAVFVRVRYLSGSNAA